MYRIVLVLTILMLLSVTESSAQPGSVTTVAFSGDLVPGEGVETFTSFTQFFPVFLAGGSATLQANTSAGDRVLISGGEIAFRSGTQVAGALANTHLDFFSSNVNDNGEVVIAATYTGAGVDATNDGGMSQRSNGTNNLCAQRGDSVPGGTDVYGYFGSIRQNSLGDISFSTTLQNSGEHAIYYGNCINGFEEVDRTGKVVGDETVSQVNTISTNASRRVALYARKWTNLNSQDVRGELVGREIDGTKHVLVATGDSGNGLPIGTTVEDLFAPKINEANQVAAFINYQGDVSGTSIHQYQLNGTGIISGRSIAKTGDAAPGLVDHELLNFSNFLQNEGGKVALVADAVPVLPPVGENDPQPGVAPVQGIWFEDSSNTLQLAAHNGMQAPGLDPGVGIFGIGFPAYNDLNQVAFKSALGGPGIDFSSNEAVWATDTNGNLQLVVQKGDIFDVNDDPDIDDFRTINAIGQLENSAGTGGRSTSFDDSGRLAMMLNFSDFTSGIFIFDLADSSSSADLDLDADVDGADFLAIQRTSPALIPEWEMQFGSGVSSFEASQVPEPSSLLLTMLMAALVGIGRCERH